MDPIQSHLHRGNSPAQKRIMLCMCNGGARNNSRNVTPGEGGSMENDKRERDLSGARGNKTKSITSVNQKDEDYQ
jgi:hypothetical protein